MNAEQSLQPKNQDFESQTNGKPSDWTIYDNNQLYQTSTEQVYAGTYSAKITNLTLSAGLRSSKIPVTPGQNYEASVMSYNVDTNSYLYLEFWDAAGKRLTPVSTKVNDTRGQWARTEIRAAAPAGAVAATLLLYLSSANKGTTYYDEAAFREVTSTPSSLFDHLVPATSKTLYQLGDSGTVEWYGTRTDGSLLEAADISQVTYASSNPGVFAVHPSTGVFQALSAGSSEIKIKVTAEGTTKTTILTLRADDFSGNVTGSKTKSTYYTDAKRANAQANIAAYDWARAQRDSAVTSAAPYAAVGDDQLWSIVTPQSVSRSLGIATRYKLRQKGSPDPDDSTISSYGNYPWKIDPIQYPWKLQSPVTGRFFPTNDFASFYQSGINEYGVFDYRQALSNGAPYLTNTGDPQSDWGVDDGWGWTEANGDIWTFIAYYNHWGIWYNGFIMKALNSLRDAYLYTGDAEYAYKGLILLDRVADLYPDLDVTAYPWAKGFDNGDPSVHSAQGKAVNDIWETGLVKSLLFAYDAFFPEIEVLEDRLTAFLSAKAQTYQMANPKHSAAAIQKNIEDHIVRIVYPGMQKSQIRGNNGMHQSALALAAVVLDEEVASKMWLDYVFQSGGLVVVQDPDRPYGRQYQVTGGDLNRLLADEVDRDGMGNEAAPGYNGLWLNTFLEAAEVLDGYERYPEFDLYRNVKFQKMFSAFYRLTMLGKYTPSIGDSGFLGSPSLVGDKSHDILAFERWGNPLHAQLIYLKNGGSASGIHGSIFSPNPEQVAVDIANVIATEGPMQLDSSLMSGYGLAALRDGSPPFYANGTIYEFNDLEIVSANRGTKYLPNYNALLFQNTDGAGAAITFRFSVPAAGEYDIDMLPNKAPSYGKYKVDIDGVDAGSYDFYGASAPDSFSTLATRWLEAGPHTISFVYEGQSPGATGYYAAFKKLALVRPEDREREQQAQKDTQRDVWLYFGRNGGHGHKDTLNLGIHAYGMDLAPDLGYPDVTGSDPKRMEWTENTISHNTVVVDKSKQSGSIVGIPHHFDGDGNVQLVDVEAPRVYPSTETYRRTTSMIRVDEENSYAVDFFRVEGGSSHTFSFHSADASAVTAEGLTLVPQQDGSGRYTGTYAGIDVPYGRKEPGSGSGSGYKGSGFHYLFDVDRAANPQAPFSVDWKVKDTWGIHPEDPNVHLRLTMLSDVDQVALASGQPPQNNAKSPPSVRYMVAERQGVDLKSTFTSVIEPYRNSRTIAAAERLSVYKDGAIVTDDAVQAVKVQLANGRVDYIFYSLDPSAVYTVENRLRFQGFFGVYSERDGAYESAYLHDGTLIGPIGGPAIQKPFGSLNGTVADFTKDMSLSNEIVVNLDLRGLSPETLVGRMIHVDNDRVRNGTYEIVGVSQAPGDQRYRLDLGDTTPIRSYRDANDFSKGYVYDIAQGASFRIPLSYRDSYSAPGLVSIRLEGVTSPAPAGTVRQTVVTAVYGSGAVADATGWAHYESSDSSVAEFVNTGLLLLKKAGTTVLKATYGELTSEPVTLLVTGTTNSTAKPGIPVLSDNNGHDYGILDGTYDMTMNLWYGENGWLYRLYENGILIDTQPLSDRTPAAQSAVTPISGKNNGTYRYHAELTNAYGTTVSAEHIVTVTGATPGKPVITHNNWDGDGSYQVSMNLWWGTNGTEYRLYENGVLIDTRTLTDRTPAAQSAVTNIADRGPGTYEYRAELTNEAGAASSDILIVTVGG
ncbi:heparinase II/III domain-containing protein [Paenibacillus oceani]|uniref:Heparinase II/III family protein n=1 Tax=Paenibacillus oceani TaxID=2772510 RepID=A0A927H104_9BACL|nr:heparinase II/III family protein [Paenibacillus oceani]MBD2864260.1 heparinase II/III family protein [Paenibacillus oceani]